MKFGLALVSAAMGEAWFLLILPALALHLYITYLRAINIGHPGWYSAFGLIPGSLFYFGFIKQGYAKKTPLKINLTQLSEKQKSFLRAHLEGASIEWAAVQHDLKIGTAQKFRSENGNGSAQVVITSKFLPEVLDQATIKELYSQESMKEMFSELGTYIQSNSILIEGEPAGYCEYKLEKRRLDNVFFMHACSFIVCWKTTMIQIQCSIGGHGMTAEQAAGEFGQYLPVFRSIANSLVLTSKWK